MLRTLSVVGMYILNGYLAKWPLSGFGVISGAGLIGLTAFSRIEEKHLRD